MTRTERLIYCALIAGLLLGLVTSCLTSYCTIKDPQVVLPGWRDTTLEFEQDHTVIVFLGEDGKLYWFWNTEPGWYEIPSPIENTMWCN